MQIEKDSEWNPYEKHEAELAVLRLQLALAREALEEVVSWSMCGTQAGRVAEDALAAIKGEQQ